jgi:hypothetical protein
MCACLTLHVDDNADLKVGTTTTGDSAGEVRIFSTPRTLDAAIALVEKARHISGGAPLSAFCLFELGRLPEGLPVVLPALKKAGLDSVAQAPIDRLTDPERALESLADAGLPLARLTVNGPSTGSGSPGTQSRGDTPEREWISVCRDVADLQTRAPDDTRVRSTGADYRRCTANHRLRRRQTHCPRAAGRRQRRHDSGRLGLYGPSSRRWR